MMKSSRLYHMVLAGVALRSRHRVPMFMPRIVLSSDVDSRSQSHVAVFLGMFISPAVAVAVCIGTTLGFPDHTGDHRAARRIAYRLCRSRRTLHSKASGHHRPSCRKHRVQFVIALLHAAAEMIVVAPFFLSGALFTPEQLANGFVTSVVLLVGLGTLIHSMLDYSISISHLEAGQPRCTALHEGVSASKSKALAIFR